MSVRRVSQAIGVTSVTEVTKETYLSARAVENVSITGIESLLS